MSNRQPEGTSGVCDWGGGGGGGGGALSLLTLLNILIDKQPTTASNRLCIVINTVRSVISSRSVGLGLSSYTKPPLPVI